MKKVDRDFEEALAKNIPWVQWGEPVIVEVPALTRKLMCRICIAKHGLKGTDVGQLGFDDRQAFLEHRNKFHPRFKPPTPTPFK